MPKQAGTVFRIAGAAVVALFWALPLLAKPTCHLNCQQHAFGCFHPGMKCNASPLADCGVCKTLLGGVCVCDPVRDQPDPGTPDPPDPEDPTKPDEPGPEPRPWGVDPEGDPALYDLRPTVGGGSGGRGWGGSDAPAVPAAGDVICARQLRGFGLRLAYGRAWGFDGTQVVDVDRTQFCMRTVGPVDERPGWILFELTDFRGTIPSFEPSGLPGLPTGENELRLDAVLPSRIMLHPETGMVLGVARLEMTNDLFGMGSPVPLRLGLGGSWHLAGETLVFDRMSIESISPSDYPSSVPD